MFEDFILSSSVSTICTHSSTWIDLMLVIMFGQNPSCWTWKPLSIITFGQIPGCRIWKPLDLWQSLAWDQSLLNQSHVSIDLFKSLEVFFPTMRKAEWAKEFGKQARQVSNFGFKSFFCCFVVVERCYLLTLWHEHEIFARDGRWCDQKHLLKKWDFVQIIWGRASCKSSAVACQWWWLA